jgi:hypothetical protein
MNSVIETFEMLYPDPTEDDVKRFRETVDMQLEEIKTDTKSAISRFREARHDCEMLIGRAEQIIEAFRYLASVGENDGKT